MKKIRLKKIFFNVLRIYYEALDDKTEAILKTNRTLAFTSHPGFSGTVPVFTLKFPCPKKPLSGDTREKLVSLIVFQTQKYPQSTEKMYQPRA